MILVCFLFHSRTKEGLASFSSVDHNLALASLLCSSAVSIACVCAAFFTALSCLHDILYWCVSLPCFLFCARPRCPLMLFPLLFQFLPIMIWASLPIYVVLFPFFLLFLYRLCHLPCTLRPLHLPCPSSLPVVHWIPHVMESSIFPACPVFLID